MHKGAGGWERRTTPRTDTLFTVHGRAGQVFISGGGREAVLLEGDGTTWKDVSPASLGLLQGVAGGATDALELGLAEQQAGQEGAERQRQAGARGDDGAADDGEKRNAHQEVAPAGPRGQAKCILEDEAADQENRRHRQHALDQGLGQHGHKAGVAVAAEETRPG